jgi:hypothetical protein
MQLEALPGGDLIRRGLRDLAAGRETAAALLVAIGAPRLRRAGVEVPGAPFDPAEHRLYELLARDHADSAHSRYNALIRRLVSFERAWECGGYADARRIRAFMDAVGRAAKEEIRLYFTGGATAVLNGWRSSTIDVDILMIPEDEEVFRALPELKESLELNIELAGPADFIPEVPGWQERSPAIERRGRVSYRHYDLYAQALAKIERGHAQDEADVQEMILRGAVDRGSLMRHFEQIEPLLYRYPAIDPASFRRAVERVCRPESPPQAP